MKLPVPLGFDWNKANINKSWEKHKVSSREAEELFTQEIKTERRGKYMNKKLKPIPKFKNEDEERDFWASADTTEYFDISKPVQLDLSELKPSTESISLRLPSYLLARIKELANANDVPYQSLMKIFLAEKVKEALLKR